MGIIPVAKVMNSTDPYAPVRAQITKPIRYVENVYGVDIRHDPNKRDLRVEAALLPQQYGRDPLINGSLPYNTSPRLRRTPLQQMIPRDTRVPQSILKEALAQSGPFYLRRWQIWDNAPFLPSTGDVALDPRYGSDTRRFTSSFKSRGA